jgi:cobalt transporter subunit CbtB
MLSHTAAGQLAVTESSTIAQTLGACVFGMLVLFAVGFMPMDAGHNAAHDTRHTVAFPCH